ncbi:MAG: 1-acyl-sn-glycerol-3-phosphate acyltransferase [Chloroflexi bacterium]|nr:1-acyl-sn-glycerol-3-phosphate acyltransferase [Chloroflexota bacterium]
MKTLLIALTRWRVEGKENVPRHGPLIVVANHLSNIDPPLLGASVPRSVCFMAKQELFRSSFSRFIVGAYGAFPVRRGELDRDAFRQALGILRKGQALGMFPEGKRSFARQLLPIQPGTSFIAARSGAPVLPVGISGSEQVKGISVIIQRPSITVKIGRPFTLSYNTDEPLRSQLPQLSELIMKHIAELLPPSYRNTLTTENKHGN